MRLMPPTLPPNRPASGEYVKYGVLTDYADTFLTRASTPMLSSGSAGI